MNTTTPPTDAAEPIAAAKKTKSKGERFFDWAVYGGIAGVGTFVATLPLTYMFKHTVTGAKYYHGLVDLLYKGAEKIAPGLLNKEVADKAVLTTALMMGGNAMLVPVAYAEKHKATTVAGLNTILGDPIPPEEIAHEPQQTFGSLMKARLMAWGAVFVALTGAGHVFKKTFDTYENEFAEHVCKRLNKPTTVQGVVETISEETKRVVKEPGLVPSRTYLYGKIAALDVFATVAAATLLYVAGHTFARKREERKRHVASRHTSLGGMPDEVEADVAIKREGPETTIEGVRSLEGKAQESSPVAAVQV